ncbi:hypothetical protein [Clostridium sp. DJ247]|uniref:hypothetical protein n=1 Tax=Clostridium sp. DJ247 TaxID=2726188 RepID=UPI00162A784B|nr:hypothetical protein [Clostridium sp. DJ247]MBC2581355.1 hypothetical protein [Clostridium sp. DJ247]
MTNKKTLKKTEDKIYTYYRQLKEIDKLEHRINILELQQAKMRERLRHISINIEPKNINIDYIREGVQISSSEISYVDAEVISKIIKFKEVLGYTRNHIFKVKFIIREMKIQMLSML